MIGSRKPRSVRAAIAGLVALVVSAAPPTLARAQDAGGAQPSRAVFWAQTAEPVRIERLTAQGPVPVGSDTPLAWHRVRTIVGPLESAFGEYRDRARTVWRAVARLERGDTAAAEPLFDQMFDVYRGESGPTSAMVAEGLLRCRLARGAVAPSVEAWAALLAAVENDPARAAERRYALPPIIDPRTGLCADLPPIFRASPGLHRLSSIETSIGDGGASGETARVLAWYRAAASHELDRPTGLTELLLEAETDPGSGPRLVRSIVLARIAGPDRRREARDELETLLQQGRADALSWTVPWINTAIGRSLARENDPAAKRRAVVRLMHTPVNHANEAPALAALSLADAADLLENLGNRDGADALRDRLAELFPAHPAATTASATRR